MFAAVKLGAVVVAAKAPNGCVLWTCCIFLQFLGVAVTLYMYLLLAYEFEGRFGLEKKCIPILDVDKKMHPDSRCRQFTCSTTRH